MSYSSKLDNHIVNKVKVILNLWDYATKKKLEDAAGVDTSNLAGKTDFCFWELNLTT